MARLFFLHFFVILVHPQFKAFFGGEGRRRRGGGITPPEREPAQGTLRNEDDPDGRFWLYGQYGDAARGQRDRPDPRRHVRPQHAVRRGLRPDLQRHGWRLLRGLDREDGGEAGLAGPELLGRAAQPADREPRRLRRQPPRRLLRLLAGPGEPPPHRHPGGAGAEAGGRQHGARLQRRAQQQQAGGCHRAAAARPRQRRRGHRGGVQRAGLEWLRDSAHGGVQDVRQGEAGGRAEVRLRQRVHGRCGVLPQVRDEESERRERRGLPAQLQLLRHQGRGAGQGRRPRGAGPQLHGRVQPPRAHQEPGPRQPGPEGRSPGAEGAER
mmetsp:Transcript_1100/g.3142  ORF Transcript_1100/g.3142 Transcript_1100/m.3142 type:complete len:324 (+) Transcript_1100:76-1047(+)